MYLNTTVKMVGMHDNWYSFGFIHPICTLGHSFGILECLFEAKERVGKILWEFCDAINKIGSSGRIKICWLFKNFSKV